MCAVEVSKGEAAPFTGQLVTKELAISLGQKADSCDVVTKREVDFAKKMERIDIDRLQKLVAIDKAANDQRVKLLMAELKREQTWWKHPAVVAGGTVVLTVLMFWAAGEALEGIAR